MNQFDALNQTIVSFKKAKKEGDIDDCYDVQTVKLELVPNSEKPLYAICKTISKTR